MLPCSSFPASTRQSQKRNPISRPTTALSIPTVGRSVQSLCVTRSLERLSQSTSKVHHHDFNFRNCFPHCALPLCAGLLRTDQSQPCIHKTNIARTHPHDPIVSLPSLFLNDKPHYTPRSAASCSPHKALAIGLSFEQKQKGSKMAPFVLTRFQGVVIVGICGFGFNESDDFNSTGALFNVYLSADICLFALSHFGFDGLSRYRYAWNERFLRQWGPTSLGRRRQPLRLP